MTKSDFPDTLPTGVVFPDRRPVKPAGAAAAAAPAADPAAAPAPVLGPVSGDDLYDLRHYSGPPPADPFLLAYWLTCRSIALDLAAEAEAAAPYDPENPPPDPLAFDPVPRQRVRRHGWSAERQVAFIAALARCGGVSAAARHVGMTPRSAYRLLNAPGADGFAKAWDAAFEMGITMLRTDTLGRALEGDYVPVYRRGRLVRVEHRRLDRLAIALLGGRGRAIDDDRRSAVARRRLASDWKLLDAARAARQAAEAAAAVPLTEEQLRRANSRPRGEPRIVGL